MRVSGMIILAVVFYVGLVLFVSAVVDALMGVKK
jgi:hypothetical protein